MGDRILSSRLVGCLRIGDPQGDDATTLFDRKKLLVAEEGHSLFATLTVIAVVVAVAARWYGLATHDLWFDEGYSLWLSQFSLRDIWERLKDDNSPPLFYWLLHFWTRLFGLSTVALRSMSAFFATISIPVFFMVSKQILQKKTALLALWLYAVCVFQVHYAKDARFYALLGFCSITSLFCLIVFLGNRSIVSFVGLVITLAAGLYTHNMMLFYMPGLALAWLLYPSSQSLVQRTRDGLICATLVLLVYLPWLPSLVAQTKNVSSSFWVPKPTLSGLADTVFQLAGLDFLYIYNVFYLMLPSWPFHHARAFTVALMLPLVPCVVGAFWKVSSPERRKAAALLCYSLCPVLLVFFYSLRSTPIFLARTFIASSAVILILITCSVAYHTGVERRLLGTLAAIVLLGSTISLIGFVKYYQTEDWRGTTEYLGGLPQQRRLIVFATTASQALFDYYFARYPHPSGAGLLEEFNLQNDSDDQMLLSIRQAVESSGLDEIDVFPSHAAQQRRELLQRYLTGLCSGLEEREFKGVKVIRCKVSRNLAGSAH